MSTMSLVILVKISKIWVGDNLITHNSLLSELQSDVIRLFTLFYVNKIDYIIIGTKTVHAKCLEKNCW